MSWFPFEISARRPRMGVAGQVRGRKTGNAISSFIFWKTTSRGMPISIFSGSASIGFDSMWRIGTISSAFDTAAKDRYVIRTAAGPFGAAVRGRSGNPLRLVGGLYGVSFGRAFFGESMFAHLPDPSKVAFVELVRQVERWGFELVDCQVKTERLARSGAMEV